MSIGDAIGRGLSKVGEGLTEAAFMERKAELLAKRDAQLAKYRSDEQAVAQQASAQEGILNRAVTTRGQDMQADYQQGVLANQTARTDMEADRQTLQMEELKLKKKQLEGELENNKLTRKIKGLELESQEGLMEAYNIIRDPQVPAAQRDAAVQYVNIQAGKGGKKLIQLRDEYGDYTDAFAILDESTGQLTKVDAEGPVVMNPGKDASLGGKPQPKAANPSEGQLPREVLMNLGAGGYTESNPARPQSQAEFDALPKGAYYEDTDDSGRLVVYVKTGAAGSGGGIIDNAKQAPAR